MQFISTRDNSISASFEQAVFQGLSPDGGLYHFRNMPDLSGLISSFGRDTQFIDIASEITASLFPEEFGTNEAKAIAEQAFPFSPALQQLDESIQCLELFHGPTCAFKDFGASFLATVMEYYLEKKDSRAIILTATSGDTGSAVAQAFYGKENIDVLILYPQNRVSPLQEKQLTTLGKNIHALEVKGSFDDCQRMVKDVFVQTEYKNQYNLTSANSINLGRLIPQSFYYIWAHSKLKNSGNLAFTVPSGNFGNLTAALYAEQWGMNVDFFIAATNRNDVVPEYLKTGLFNPRESVKTLSNAMDVGNPSNFERMLALFNNDWTTMKNRIIETVVSDKITKEVISSYFSKTGNYLDPHTAVGYYASKQYLQNNDYNGTIVSVATAHPGKFLEIVKEVTNTDVPLPPQLSKLLDLEKKSTVIENTAASLQDFITSAFGKSI